VGAVTAIIGVVAVVVGLVWWYRSLPSQDLPPLGHTRTARRFVGKKVKGRQKTELTDPIAQW
jgi:hypothetical protein